MLRLDLANLIFTVINLLVIFFLMKKFLFGRVNDILAQREEAIKKQFDDAEEAKKSAQEAQRQYEESLSASKQESAQIVQEAKDKAREEYDRIVKLADEEVTKKLKKAEETINEEKSKAIRSMEADIEDLIVAAASKVVGEQVSAENSKKLYDEFLMRMGEENDADSN